VCACMYVYSDLHSTYNMECILYLHSTHACYTEIHGVRKPVGSHPPHPIASDPPVSISLHAHTVLL